jgi:ornithine cyclodeaminase/alanine dehydrogenase-like protein (mu-crystallin family)
MLVHPRRRLNIPGKSYLHYMAAGDSASGYMGMKIYTTSRHGLRFIVPLFNAESGDLLALLEADYLGQVRTGAASGVATKFMAPQEVRTVGIIGTGGQARTQLEAIVLVRKVESVHAYSRDAKKCEEFAREMSVRLKVPVTAVDSSERAVRDRDLVITATTSTQPVLSGAWLKPGAHINAIGANFPQKRELDDEAVSRAGLIAVDSREQAKMEAGDLIRGFGGDESRWERVQELADIVARKTKGRTGAQQITLFKSSGIASEDIAVAGPIYELAKERGMGREISMWETESRSARGR